MEREFSGRSPLPSGPLLIPFEAGEKFHTGRLGTQWKIDGPQTGGRFSVIHHQLPPRTKWGVYQAANSVLLWVNPKTAKIVIGQFTERGSDSPVVSTQPISPKFDGNWMWMDKEGRIQPRVTLFDGLFRQNNPYLPRLDFTYRTLALRMRDAQCDNCHVPNNPWKMRRLVLMHTPAHAAGEISRLMKAVREDRMPIDDNGIDQPLEPALKRALLEAGGAFEELVKAAKEWEAAHRD